MFFIHLPPPHHPTTPHPTTFQHGIITESDLHELLRPLHNTLEHFQNAQYTYSLGKSVRHALPIHLKRIKAIGGLQPGWEEKLKRGFSGLDADGSAAPKGDAASVEELQEMFNRFDTDGSGTLERPELEKLMKLMKLPVGRVDDLFAKADSDGDGEISFAEFSKASILRDVLRRNNDEMCHLQ